MSFPPPQLEKSWASALGEEWNKPYIKDLAKFVQQERASHKVFPKKEDVFAAFNYTPFDQVNVVIIGQDPYHDEGQAHGLCFSVPVNIKPPPSLKNIFKEIEADLGIPPPNHGVLTSWAKQGVLLLNATLTVRAHSPASHHGQGWEQFTDRCVQELAKRKDPIIFVLWGRFAAQKCIQLQETHHHVLKAAHPSPFSAHSGFFGCRHFSKINDLLTKQGKEPINWDLR